MSSFGGLAVLAAISTLAVTAPRWDSSTNMDPAQFYSLKFVAVVTRHGSRSPLNTWPSDAYPYTDRRFWPAGPTQLTRYGKMQMYRVGKVLRTRYSGFLPEEYFPNDTLAEYNPYDRDFGSAACLLAGLYPPIGQEVWNDRLPWQPIRMYLHQFDICDLSDVGVCPTFLEEYNNERSRYNEESAKYQALLDHLTNHTGKTISTLTGVSEVYDTLIMQQQNGYKLPSWSNSVMSQMHPINVKSLILGYAGNNKLLQLGAGEELRYLNGLLDAKANDKMPNTRLYIQAAHDCTLVAILRAMGRTEMDLEIQTGAFIAIELHEIKPTHFVQLKDDCVNYLEHQMMGTRLRLKKGAVPHVFECQGRSSTISRVPPSILKRERRRIVDEALRNASKIQDNGEGIGKKAKKTSLEVPDRASNSGLQHSSISSTSVTEDQPQLEAESGADMVEVVYHVDIFDERDELTNREKSPELSAPIYCVYCGSYQSKRSGDTEERGTQANIRPKCRSLGVLAKASVINPQVHATTSPIKCFKKKFSILPDKERLASSSSPSTPPSDQSYPDFRPSSTSGSDFSAPIEREDWNKKWLVMTKERVKRFPMENIGLPFESFFLIRLLSEVLPIPYSHIMLVLKKIRLNQSFFDVALDFGLSESQGSRVFKNNLCMMANSLKELIIWPERRLIREHLPIAFRYRYGKVESIVDCFEIQCERPSNPLHQALTWSNYKSCNTIKYLISCTPDGLINFISEGYGGRASDSYILEDCGFVDKLKPGCSVMADRGFKDIAPLVVEKGCKLIRPPTVRAGTISPKEEVKLTKQIAALRIIVERVIGRLRNFDMLKPHATIDFRLVPSLDYIVQIACSIANMQSHLFKEQF